MLPALKTTGMSKYDCHLSVTSCDGSADAIGCTPVPFRKARNVGEITQHRDGCSEICVLDK